MRPAATRRLDAIPLTCWNRPPDAHEFADRLVRPRQRPRPAEYQPVEVVLRERPRRRLQMVGRRLLAGEAAEAHWIAHPLGGNPVLRRIRGGAGPAVEIVEVEWVAVVPFHAAVIGSVLRPGRSEAETDVAASAKNRRVKTRVRSKRGARHLYGDKLCIRCGRVQRALQPLERREARLRPPLAPCVAVTLQDQPLAPHERRLVMSDSLQRNAGRLRELANREVVEAKVLAPEPRLEPAGPQLPKPLPDAGKCRKVAIAFAVGGVEVFHPLAHAGMRRIEDALRRKGSGRYAGCVGA